jgi:hypothetical protein
VLDICLQLVYLLLVKLVLLLEILAAVLQGLQLLLQSQHVFDELLPLGWGLGGEGGIFDWWLLVSGFLSFHRIRRLLSL